LLFVCIKESFDFDLIESECLVFVCTEFHLDSGWKDGRQWSSHSICDRHLSCNIRAARAAVVWTVWLCGWSDRPTATHSVQWMPHIICSQSAQAAGLLRLCLILHWTNRLSDYQANGLVLGLGVRYSPLVLSPMLY